MLMQTIFRTARTLARNPGFAAIVILTLALGVGANTAMFSVVNAILLRPLPVRDAKNLVVVAEQRRGKDVFSNLSYPDFIDFRNQSANVFQDMAASQIGEIGIRSEGKAERAIISYVTSNYFDMLGVQPAIGRLIAPGEGDSPGADPVIVFSYSYWQKRFNLDPGIVGKTVVANGRALTVVGVAAKDFRGTNALAEMDAYLPLNMAVMRTVAKGDPNDFWTRRDIRTLHVVAYPKPGVADAVATARSALFVIAQRLAQAYPETDRDMTARVFPERLARPVPTDSNLIPAVGMLFLLLAGIVLWVACMNVANILLVRSIARQREAAIRVALGSNRYRLIRESLVESLILAIAGGAAGILLGEWACALLKQLRHSLDFPLYLDFSLDWRVFAYSFGLAVLTGIAVGVLPALRASNVNINQVLHQGGRGTSAGRWQGRIGNALVVAQVASSLMLLIVAGLFLRSLNSVQHVNLGFDPDHELNVTMDTHLMGYDEARGRQFYRELEDRIRSVPGVQAASLSYSVPFGVLHETSEVIAEAGADQAKQPPEVTYNTVDPPYFENLKIPFVRGRGFTDGDKENAPLVAVINLTMARQLWPNEDAIGKRFSMGTGQPMLQVIGIAEDGRYIGPADDPEAYFFVPASQHYVSFRTLQVKTAAPPETMIPEIEKFIWSIAPDMPIIDCRSMNDAANGLNGFLFFRVGAGLAGAMGLLSLVLALVGIYGVIAYSVTRRTQEIGIRMAVGALPRDVLRLIMGQGSRVIAAGIVVGLVLAFGASRLLKSFLVGVSAMDALTFGSVSLLLALVAMIAITIPALQATRVDPATTLRAD